MKNLDSLGLAHNKLKEVPARVFSHLPVLNSLELDGNAITFVDPEAFSGVEGNITFFLYKCIHLHAILIFIYRKK